MPILEVNPLIVREKDTQLIKVKFVNTLRIGQDQAWTHKGWTNILGISYQPLKNDQQIFSLFNRNNWVYITGDTEVVLNNEKQTTLPIYQLKPNTRPDPYPDPYLLNVPFPLDYGTYDNNAKETEKFEEKSFDNITHMINHWSVLQCKKYFLSCRNNLEPFRVLTWGYQDTQLWNMLGTKAGMHTYLYRFNTPSHIYFNLNYQNFYANFDFSAKHNKNIYRNYMSTYFPFYYEIHPFKVYNHQYLYDSHCGNWVPGKIPTSDIRYHNDLSDNMVDRMDLYFDKTKDRVVDVMTQNGFYQAGLGKLIFQCKKL